MKARLTPRQLLGDALHSGSLLMGQILITGGFILHHFEDGDCSGLAQFDNPHDARVIARYDALGQFRPLKSAPNLKRGWQLHLDSLESVELALDFFYPGALGLWFDWIDQSISPTPLRESLERQSGMYRETRRLTDVQANILVAKYCDSRSGCLKKMLWEISPGNPIQSLPASKLTAQRETSCIPLICREVCNLVIAGALDLVERDLPNRD